MMRMRTIELMVGAFMLIGILALFFLALQVSNLSTVSNGEGYTITARFDNIGSLKVKAPVSMAGVKVGRVSAISFDGSSYEAVVTLAIGNQYDTIPDDTFAKIYTAGLLGEQYVGLEAGGSEIYLEDGSEIEMTQSSLVLEEVIGQFLFSKAEGGSGKEASSDSKKEGDSDSLVDTDLSVEAEAGKDAEGAVESEVADDLVELVKPEEKKADAVVKETKPPPQKKIKPKARPKEKSASTAADESKAEDKTKKGFWNWVPKPADQNNDTIQIH